MCVCVLSVVELVIKVGNLWPVLPHSCGAAQMVR